MDDLLNEFLTETNESLEVVDVELVKLEQDPNNKDVLDNIFRLVHTIKGTCGFLGLPRLEAVAHASENVLGRFRDGDMEVTREAVSVVLESLDRIKEILAVLEETEQEPEGDDSELIARLDSILERAEAGEGAAPAAEADSPARSADAGGSEVSQEDETGEPEASEETSSQGDSGETAGEEGVYDPELGRELKPGEVPLDELERAFQEATGPDEGGDAASAQPEPAKAADAQASAGEQTAASPARLYERVGGADNIGVIAHLLANRVGRDAKLAPIFDAFSEDERKAKFTGLLTALFKDDDAAANTVIEGLVAKPGFGEEQFDALVALAKSVFEETQLDGETCEDACMTFELVRQRALEASTKADKNGQGEQTGQGGQGGQGETGEGAGSGGSGGKRSGQSIRVSVDLLEDLMNMVSELVLTRNQLLQMTREDEESEFAVPVQRLSQTTSELQEGVMKTRMQPIGNAWSKLPRIVRDLSVEMDKKIELEMTGQETDLDRQVLELIKDPLTHMVRNAVDHGIETSAERVAMGKPETGTIHLHAYHEGGHIIIDIRDDGRGVSTEKIKQKALEKGLVSETALAEMSESQIQKFIFHPGFSTAGEVTSVSGRGVGMDVVRSNIEKIGGTIDMNSVEGEGTACQIKIPLTLAIVAALIVEASGERFAVPQISVLELVRAKSSGENRIERIKNTPVLRLRDRLLPLVYLNEVLGLASREELDAREDAEDFVVVTQVGTSVFGIVVDTIYDTEEIVVKPVAPILKNLSVYSGNTILGDGSVVMILDPNGVAETANAAVSDEADLAQEAAEAQESESEEETESLILVRSGESGRKAVPLALVARLEEVDVKTVETADDKYVVQYRGSLMPLVMADGCIQFKSEGRQPVLVFTDGDYTMGLVVDEIMDIVEETVDIDLASKRPGIVGSTIVDGKAAEMLDVAYYLEQAFDDWMRSRDQTSGLAPSKGTKVLLVDDSAFFRNMLKPLLTVAGYEVTLAASAQEALDLREEGHGFDLIISDIDMPGMDGFELAQILKTGGRWADIPLVALSNYASERHLARGREVGFNDYIAKFDREALLESLSQQLKFKQGEAA